ncbi:MAG: hypothetical protein AAF716_03770 [Cyanobacteria bacterium P01_D01_bin.1]
MLLKKGRFNKSENLVPVFILSSMVMSGLALLTGFLCLVGILYIGGKATPSLVQLEDGRSIAVEPVGKYDRTPKVIVEFVRESLSQLFTWNATSKIDAQGTTRTIVSDDGVEIEGDRITTRTWRASFSIAEDFRTQMLAEIASLTPDEIFSGTAQSVLNIDSIATPVEIEPGLWEVDVVATLLIFNSRHPEGLAVPFNKKMVIAAVEPSQDPLPEETTSIQKAVYQTRASGLMIQEMYELQEGL